MTSPIDQLLGRARLVDASYTPEEINAAAQRVAARTAARRAEPHTAEVPGPMPEGPREAAARDLRTLCETAVMSRGALASLKRFVAPSLPEPPGARVLGCVLQLTEREDSARFWWQYAAGAGDGAAVHCLYLQHLAHGEEREARWWGAQTIEAVRDQGRPGAEPRDLGATLRVLRDLRDPQGDEAPTQDLITRAAQVGAVLTYVPAAVSYRDDDLDLPLPDADFADHITSLTAPSVPGAHPRRPRPPALRPEPRPRPAASLIGTVTRPSGPARQRPATPATTPARWTWNDSGGAFGHKQRVGIGDLAEEARRQHAMQAFWLHCEGCADCDPAGIPCPAHTTLCPDPP
ncbi:hypothetical protein [Streptomyces sp. NPDC012510]|uniref:hypothetical protein n=1 Tax=Streptomyces sp. NPDC012510 TaxID=3364838 RepID=UPI0036EC9E73